MFKRFWRRVTRCGMLTIAVAAAIFSLAAMSRAAELMPIALADPLNAAHNIEAVFGDEMRQAAEKLKWRGEHLTEDTAYAVALTGVSWEMSWGNEHLFSLGWGDTRKVPTLGKRADKRYQELVAEIRQKYDSHDYRGAVERASSSFSLDEIACDVNLKEPVGFSLLASGEPERAFPILSAPFEPPHDLTTVSDLNRRFREAAFDAARRAGLAKEAVAFGLSLLLEPGPQAPDLNVAALRFLEESGVDVDRVMLGILQSPERLRGLPAYIYAASDLLAYRATPRLLPFLLHLATSDDVYLRSRALIGLGIVAYQKRSGDPANWASKVVVASLTEYGLSASERGLINKEIRTAATSDKYRLRTSAAIALALIGEDTNVPLLQKLAKDRAYVMSPPVSGDPRNRHLLFPVRMAATAALARYGVPSDAGGGNFSGKQLDIARRGNEDASNDRRNLRKEVASQILVSPVDVASATLVTGDSRRQ